MSGWKMINLEKIPVYIPALRGLIGGLVGWILGFGTAFLVLRLLRSDKPAALKVLGAIGLNLACLIVVEVLGLGLITIINQFR